MNKKVIVVGLIAIGFVGLIVVKLLSNKEEVAKKIFINDVNDPILVEAIQPSMHTFQSEFSYLGTFEPYRQNIIGAEGQGRIVSLNVQEGDRIAQGGVIAKLDDEMLQLQIDNLEVSIEGQKNDDNRYTSLSKDAAIPAVQVEKTKLGLKSSEIQKKQLQKQLRGTVLKAPFSGVITKKLVDLGSVIGMGSPVVEITDVSSLKLTVNVPERDIMKFSMNQLVNVSIDVYPGEMFQGKVSLISIQADKTHNFKVQVLVNNAKGILRAGMYGTSSLVNSSSISAFSIPRKALVGSTKQPKVYVIRNGKAVLVSFNAGTADGEFIEVVSGLSKNDKIVIKGQVNLTNNAPVKTNK